MGFLSKLFGGGNNSDNENTGGHSSLDGIGTLRTARVGGYDKSDTLMMLDAFNTQIFMLEEAVKNADRGLPYDIPPEQTVEMPRSVANGGFNEEDVNVYVAQLQEKIDALRSKLAERSADNR